MTNEKNANQEPEPNNEEVENEEEIEEKPEESPEHYEHMVDDAIRGVMDDDESG